MQFGTSTTIDAPPEAVWSVLIDLESWPSWDSAVVRTEGHIAAGQRIKLWPDISPEHAFALRVTQVDAPTALTFQGGMPLGLFRGVRTFRLAPHDGNRTTFEMREVYTGPLRPLISRRIPDLQPSFETFAAGLKQRTEATRAP